MKFLLSFLLSVTILFGTSLEHSMDASELNNTDFEEETFIEADDEIAELIGEEEFKVVQDFFHFGKKQVNTFTTQEAPNFTVLPNSMLVHYTDKRKRVQSVKSLFSKGKFYARLRANNFFYKWQDILRYERDSLNTFALGGSLVYRSAVYRGFGMRLGFYVANSYGSNISDEQIKEYKFTTDLLSDYEDISGVLAQAYIGYYHPDFKLRVGRQLFESYLTKSNDVKMIPNAFEGVSFSSKTLLPKSKIRLAYFTKQKLREHTNFHHILAYGDNPNDPYAQYSGNDDRAMHRGLTLSKLQAKGIEDRLFVGEIQYRGLHNTPLHLNITAVPNLLSSLTLQVSHTLRYDNLTLKPALRVMQQFDHGAGDIGGANLAKDSRGYSKANSLDATLFATRLDVNYKQTKWRFAYSKVSDGGDIVAPWRGFPTGGFTRLMTQYNWQANTQSVMAQFYTPLPYVKDFDLLARAAYQDFDDTKPGVQADAAVYSLDLVKRLINKHLFLKIRYVHVEGKQGIQNIDGSLKADPSDDKARFEINYLF